MFVLSLVFFFLFCLLPLTNGVEMLTVPSRDVRCSRPEPRGKPIQFPGKISQSSGRQTTEHVPEVRGKCPCIKTKQNKTKTKKRLHFKILSCFSKSPTRKRSEDSQRKWLSKYTRTACLFIYIPGFCEKRDSCVFFWLA